MKKTGGADALRTRLRQLAEDARDLRMEVERDRRRHPLARANDQRLPQAHAPATSTRGKRKKR